MRRDMIATLVGLISVLLLAGAALAAKPSSGLTLVVVSSSDARTASTGEPAYGGQITFDVTTTQSDRPYVNVRCWQGTDFVYDGWHGFFDGYMLDPVFSLFSDYWHEGGASCTARLVDWSGRKEKTLTTMSFTVSG